ncbi:hypothetical protein HHK36_009402 [Tetracentron sinense]|uniref:Uncharacterized protein n=1 Tax=Tetracentron sinense TaxID=13715 RepID=A0A834ZCT7_TETSI|nr:hypothetical protein HHK36_009402 [Tetracentron sinense]
MGKGTKRKEESKSPEELPKESTKASSRGKRVKAPAASKPEKVPEFFPEQRNLVSFLSSSIFRLSLFFRYFYSRSRFTQLGSMSFSRLSSAMSGVTMFYRKPVKPAEPAEMNVVRVGCGGGHYDLNIFGAPVKILPSSPSITAEVSGMLISSETVSLNSSRNIALMKGISTPANVQLSEHKNRAIVLAIDLDRNM